MLSSAKIGLAGQVMADVDVAEDAAQGVVKVSKSLATYPLLQLFCLERANRCDFVWNFCWFAATISNSVLSGNRSSSSASKAEAGTIPFAVLQTIIPADVMVTLCHARTHLRPLSILLMHVMSTPKSAAISR